MTDDERKRLREKAEQKRKGMIAKIEAEFLETVKSIDRVWTLDNEPNAELIEPKPVYIDLSQPHSLPKPVRKKLANGPASSVREAIQHMDEFSTPDIDDYIKANLLDEKIDRAAISSVLNKMRNSREIVQTVSGQGRSPHKYRKSFGAVPP